jgi:hypothetical protein
MSDLNSPSHVSLDELEDYLEAKLSDERQREIEIHFATCSECTERARELRKFRTLWTKWTAQAHGAAVRRQAAAAVVINFERPNLFTPLPGYDVTLIPALAAGDASIEAMEYGEIDFLPTERLPPGATIEALEAEKTITVVIPCEKEFEHNPPRVELLLEKGQVLTTNPEQKPRFIRERAGDPGTLQEKTCWVAHFNDVPLQSLLVIVTPQLER